MNSSEVRIYSAPNHYAYRVTRLCQALGVSASGYYAWRCRSESTRVQQADNLPDADQQALILVIDSFVKKSQMAMVMGKAAKR